MSQVRKPIEMFRQWHGDKPLNLKCAGEKYTAQPGDWVCFDLIRTVPGPERKKMGPVLKPRAIQRLTGVMPDPGQKIVRTGNLQAAPPKMGAAKEERARVGLVNVSDTHEYTGEACVPVVEMKSQGWVEALEEARERELAWIVVSNGPYTPGWLSKIVSTNVALFGALDAAHMGDGLISEPGLHRCRHVHPEVDGALLLCDEGVVLPGYALRAMHQVLAANPHVPAVAPIMNLADPVGLPMPGDDGSSLPRTMPGKGVIDISLALYLDAAPPIKAHPKDPGCLLVRPEFADQIANDEKPDLTGTLIAMDAYAWRPLNKADGLAASVSSNGGESPGDWPTLTSRSRAAIWATKPRSLPVWLYTHVVGPWGGVGALFGVADQLQHYGISATVVNHVHVEHKFRPRTAPLKVHNTDVLVGDPARALGAKEGILVGSHWYSGVAAKKIVERCPGILPMSFFQDREDWFLDRAGKDKQLKPDQCRDYLAIGRGISVSQWIIDSLAEESKIRHPENYEIIPCGIDCNIFHPVGRRATNPKKIRILAMWRPSTAARRGMPRLRAVYEEIRRRAASFKRWKGMEVSLELFGWADKTGRVETPPCDIHHGVLSPVEVGELLRQVDIVVEPSDYQGLGLPGLEAMACGAALASTSCRGVDEYAIHEENSLVVPHDDLADAIQKLALDPKLRESLREPGIEAGKNLDWSRVGARWALHIVDLWQRERGNTRFDDALARAQAKALEALER